MYGGAISKTAEVVIIDCHGSVVEQMRLMDGTEEALHHSDEDVSVLHRRPKDCIFLSKVSLLKSAHKCSGYSSEPHARTKGILESGARDRLSKVSPSIAPS